MRVAIVCAVALLSAGCQAPQAFPKEFGEVARVIVEGVAEQGIYEKFATHVDGQVIEPGIEGYAGVLYIAGGKLRGVSGRVALEGSGVGSGAAASDATMEHVRLLLRDNPTFADELAKLIAASKTATAPASQPPQ